jgi:hypothetical protein
MVMVMATEVMEMVRVKQALVIERSLQSSSKVKHRACTTTIGLWQQVNCYPLPGATVFTNLATVPSTGAS